MKEIEVIICDDHAIFRDGIKTTLFGQESVKVIAEAENGVECLEAVKTRNPHVVLLDINMPVMDGITCLKELKKDYSDIKVIALTQHNEKRFVKQMLKYGADGYILKSTTRKELLLALAQVMKGKVYLAEEPSQALQNLNAEAVPSSLFPDLGDRELQIVKMLCEEYSSKQIADQLNISHHTVESHRSNVFKKIGVSNVAGLVKWAVNNGFD